MSRELENDLRCLKFTLGLPLVERDKTLVNGAECVICKEPYGEIFQIRGPEIGCQLPCNCIIGHLCAWKHFAPSIGAHVTCPVCHMRFPELNKIDEGVFSPPTKCSRRKHKVVQKQTATTESGSCPGQVDENGTKNTKPSVLRGSSSRRSSVAHVAVKAIDLVAKRSG